jgi:hypothetical protein
MSGTDACKQAGEAGSAALGTGTARDQPVPAPGRVAAGVARSAGVKLLHAGDRVADAKAEGGPPLLPVRDGCRDEASRPAGLAAGELEELERDAEPAPAEDAGVRRVEARLARGAEPLDGVAGTAARDDDTAEAPVGQDHAHAIAGRGRGRRGTERRRDERAREKAPGERSPVDPRTMPLGAADVNRKPSWGYAAYRRACAGSGIASSSCSGSTKWRSRRAPFASSQARPEAIARCP